MQDGALFPDLVQIGCGTSPIRLDTAALNDLNRWVTQVFKIPRVPDTPSIAKNWTLLLYHALMIVHVARGPNVISHERAKDMVHSLLKEVCEEVLKRTFETMVGADIFDKFRVDFLKAQQSNSTQVKAPPTPYPLCDF